MDVKRPSDRSANGLTNSIIDFFKFKGGDANRINTQGKIRRFNWKANCSIKAKRRNG
jgi:hypothetical protein